MTNKDKVKALKKLRELTVKHFDVFFIGGLCIVLSKCDEDFLPREVMFLRTRIQQTKERRAEIAGRHFAYGWPAGEIEPRLKWLDVQIAEYEGKTFKGRVRKLFKLK